MPTRLVDPAWPDPEIIAEAAAHLRAGRLVAFPTETVYGLGAHALDPAAVARIYAAKGRPSYNPLIVHLPDASEVLGVASVWTDAARALAERFWPGPLTLVVPRRPNVPDVVTAGLPTVAVRVPAHGVAHALLAAAGIPVAAPSANRSTELSPTRAQHVERALGDRVAMILDAGPTRVGIESTVVDVSGAQPVLLRPGGISRLEIEQVVGPLGAAAASDAGTALPSPGMMERHYAPRAQVVLFEPGGRTPEGLLAFVRDVRQRNGVAGALVPVASSALREAADMVVALGADPEVYGRGLYDALHQLDERGCTAVAVEMPPDHPAWEGVRDRLRRASRP